jgi:hypothetical protein
LLIICFADGGSPLVSSIRHSSSGTTGCLSPTFSSDWVPARV